MSIEEKIFGRKRFVPEAMREFGFIKTDGGYLFEGDLMNGDFSAVLTVSGKGDLAGTVIDKINGEEYRQLRMEIFQGAYVGSVRAAYEEWLGQIAAACCRDVLFSSDQANRIAERIADGFGIEPDYPWEQDRYQSYGVFRHPKNSKWFALIMNVKRQVLLKNGDETTVDIINLKADPEEIVKLTEQNGIYPSYHMNHKYWISVLLDDSLTDDAVMSLVNESFDLTKNRQSPVIKERSQ
ncbi:MAG: MmcQ/YjbR family DNA-binding protein [Firmicutes bacterium]|nr:MmcQ/YjbR family DNA-binding protein [Bacillota bacterium]